MGRTVRGIFLLVLLYVCVLSSSLAFAQFMPFMFPCSYSRTADEGSGEEGEVALSVSIHGNPSYYVPEQLYQGELLTSLLRRVYFTEGIYSYF